MEAGERCELVRLDKVEDSPVDGSTYVVIYVKQDTIDMNPIPSWQVKPLPRWRDGIYQKSYQRTVCADCKGKSVLPVVFGTSPPQYEGEHGWSCKMQGIKEGSKIIKNRHSIELLKNKSWHRTKDLQLGVYRFSYVNKTSNSPHDPIHSLIRQE